MEEKAWWVECTLDRFCMVWFGSVPVSGTRERIEMILLISHALFRSI